MVAASGPPAEAATPPVALAEGGTTAATLARASMAVSQTIHAHDFGRANLLIEVFVGGDRAPSAVPTGLAVAGTTLGAAQSLAAGTRWSDAPMHLAVEAPPGQAIRSASQPGSEASASRGASQPASCSENREHTFRCLICATVMTPLLLPADIAKPLAPYTFPIQESNLLPVLEAQIQHF